MFNIIAFLSSEVFLLNFMFTCRTPSPAVTRDSDFAIGSTCTGDQGDLPVLSSFPMKLEKRARELDWESCVFESSFDSVQKHVCSRCSPWKESEERGLLLDFWMCSLFCNIRGMFGL